MHSEGRAHIQQYACSVQAATHIDTERQAHTHTHAQTHRAHCVLFSIPSVSWAAANTKRSLSLLLLSTPLLSPAASHRLSSCLILSSSPSFLHLLCLSAEQPCEAAINAHTLVLFFYCFVKWREREGADNNGRVGWDEIEEKHKYRQQTLITQARFDSRHKPSTSCKWKTDRKLDSRQLFLFSHFWVIFGPVLNCFGSLKKKVRSYLGFNS